jgi:hypothetical protein
MMDKDDMAYHGIGKERMGKRDCQGPKMKRLINAPDARRRSRRTPKHVIIGAN